MTIVGCILAGISTVLSMVPFVYIWFVIRDILNAMIQGNIALAVSSGHYAWLAVVFSLLSILLYFGALCCSHLAAFRTATNMKKEAMHHIVTLPLGYFSQNASGRFSRSRISTLQLKNTRIRQRICDLLPRSADRLQRCPERNV